VKTRLNLVLLFLTKPLPTALPFLQPASTRGTGERGRRTFQAGNLFLSSSPKTFRLPLLPPTSCPRGLIEAEPTAKDRAQQSPCILWYGVRNSLFCSVRVEVKHHTFSTAGLDEGGAELYAPAVRGSHCTGIT
jgi:hypothetical protein